MARPRTPRRVLPPRVASWEFFGTPRPFLRPSVGHPHRTSRAGVTKSDHVRSAQGPCDTIAAPERPGASARCTCSRPVSRRECEPLLAVTPRSRGLQGFPPSVCPYDPSVSRGVADTLLAFSPSRADPPCVRPVGRPSPHAVPRSCVRRERRMPFVALRFERRPKAVSPRCLQGSADARPDSALS